MQMADFGLSRVLEANATHVSTFTYGEQALHLPRPAMGCQFFVHDQTPTDMRMHTNALHAW